MAQQLQEIDQYLDPRGGNEGFASYRSNHRGMKSEYMKAVAGTQSERQVDLGAVMAARTAVF